VHHVLTLNYSWYVFADVPATARWMVNMNFLIHSMMYTYYALRSLRVSIPRYVNMTITTLQIAQMFAGLYINYRTLQHKLIGMPCDISMSVAVTGFTLYGLFAVLFMNFFLRTYLFRSKSKSITFINDINHNQQINNCLKKLQWIWDKLVICKYLHFLKLVYHFILLKLFKYNKIIRFI